MVTIERALGNATRVRVDVLGERTLRVRFVGSGEFTDTGLNRYGFIRTESGADVAVSSAEAKGVLTITTPAVRLSCRLESGEIAIEDIPSGRTILRQIGAAFARTHAEASFEAGKDEDWVGFGDQTRKRLYHRGHTVDCIVRNVKSYVPVPLFMSTRGVGILVNTTHRVAFDMAHSQPDRFLWRDRRGVVDYYVMAAPTFREILDLYTALTGRPKMPPEWAFGLWFICRTQANDDEAVNNALNFRREGIPCDVIGLEPGWMDKTYNLSTEKTWNKERFPLPAWAPNGPHNFFNAIKRMGFHFELWMCVDYDLSYEAERRIGCDPLKDRVQEVADFHPGAEVDEHFEQMRYLDTHTKPAEAWYEHLKKFVDQGADFFKQDGAFQVLEHPDRAWGNGMSDAEMHNLYPLLYSRQMHEGFQQHTGRRPVVFTCAGWTGFQAWSGTWTGDTGGKLATLGAMLNTSMVGHSWATNDMEVVEKEAIHFGYLLPWSQINSWHYFRMPWIQGDAVAEMHKFYACLRSRLIPYIYCWAQYATQTGYPLMAPLTLEFQDDPHCREILNQYLLGRDLMVCAYKKEAYFPAGRWKDFWTGEVVQGPQTRAIEWPENRGGGLYVREGGIVPFGPLMQYRKQLPLDEIELYVFPGPEEASLAFYEDDGVSLKHLEGESCTTRITACAAKGSAAIEVAATQGTFEGMVTSRKWMFVIALDVRPGRVTANGKDLPHDAWSYDETRSELKVKSMPGPVRLEVQ